jgi:hypothetical protein
MRGMKKSVLVTAFSNFIVKAQRHMFLASTLWMAVPTLSATILELAKLVGEADDPSRP